MGPLNEGRRTRYKCLRRGIGKSTRIACIGNSIDKPSYRQGRIINSTMMEIILDFPFGFPINKIISLDDDIYQKTKFIPVALDSMWSMRTLLTVMCAESTA